MSVRPARRPPRRKRARAGPPQAPGSGMSGGREIARREERGDHRKVEEHRRGGGRLEAVHRVQHGRKLRHDRDADQIGKGDARQLDGERALRRIVVEAGRQHARSPTASRPWPPAAARSAPRAARRRLHWRIAGLVGGLLSGPSRPAKRGTKAALKAPSAKIARKWLGRRSATMKASEAHPPQDRRHQDVAQKPGHARQRSEATNRKQAT